MSAQELITQEYNMLRRARNNRTLTAQYNDMTNEELMAYAREKWEAILGGAA